MFSLPPRPSKKKLNGFTLIELLLVVVVLGILSGVVLTVINPANTRQRSAESVALANLGKMCQGLVACMVSQPAYNTARCDTYDEIGVNIPTAPETATWPVTPALSATSTAADSWISLSTSMPSTQGSDCNMTCVVRNDMSNWNNNNAGAVNLNVTNDGGNPQVTTGCLLR